MKGLALLLKDLTLKIFKHWLAEDYLHWNGAMRNTLATESQLKGCKGAISISALFKIGFRDTNMI